MAGQPKHTQIRRDLERAIRSGELPPGAKLPTERELCQTYGVSRATVQRAVSAMAEARLVTRRRRAGTIVTKSATDLLGFTNLLATGPETAGDHQLLSAATVPAADLDIELPGIPDDAAVHYLVRVKRDPRKNPIAIEHHAIPFTVAPRVMKEDLVQFTSLAYYHREGIPVVRSRLYINPGVAGTWEAELLQLPQGTPLFFTRRETYMQGGGLAEVYDSVLAPHAFQLFVEQNIDPEMP